MKFFFFSYLLFPLEWGDNTNIFKEQKKLCFEIRLAICYYVSLG